MRKRKGEKKGEDRCRLVGIVKQETDGAPIFSLSFWPGECDEASGEVGYLAAVGGRAVSIHALTREGGKTSVEADRQRYVDDDETEQFFACCWTTAGMETTVADTYEGSTSQKISATPVVVAGGQHGICKAIDAGRADESVECALCGHGNAINDVAAHPVDPWLILTASKDESTRMWNMITGRCVAIFAGDRGHRDEVLCVDVHRLGRLLLTSGMDNTVKIWRLDAPRVVSAIVASRHKGSRPETAFEQFPLFSTADVHSNYVDCARFAGNLVVSKSTTNQIVLWTPDIDRVKRLQAIRKATEAEHAEKVLAASPESSKKLKKKRYAKSSSTSSKQQHQKTPQLSAADAVLMKPASTPGSTALVLKTFDLPNADLWFLRFGLDASHSLLASGNMQGFVTVWGLDFDGSPLARLSHPKAITTVRQVAFSPRAAFLAFSCDDASICVFDISDLTSPAATKSSRRS